MPCACACSPHAEALPPAADPGRARSAFSPHRARSHLTERQRGRKDLDEDRFHRTAAAKAKGENSPCAKSALQNGFLGCPVPSAEEFSDRLQFARARRLVAGADGHGVEEFVAWRKTSH